MRLLLIASAAVACDDGSGSGDGGTSDSDTGSSAAAGPCTTQDDCKGDRVCTSGVCGERDTLGAGATGGTSAGTGGTGGDAGSSVHGDAAVGCGKDVDCGGDAICEDGDCVDPPAEPMVSTGSACTEKSPDPCPQEGTMCSGVGGTAVACCIDGRFKQRLDPRTGEMVVACECEQADVGIIACVE